LQHPLYIILLNACQTHPQKGGIATYTHEVAHHLGEKGHSVSLLTYPTTLSPLSPPSPYQVRRRPSFDLSELVRRGESRSYLLSRLPLKVIAMARDTARLVRSLPGGKEDRILWAITWWPEALAAFLVSRMTRIPYVVTAHGYEAIVSPDARRHVAYKKALNGAARVFAVSSHTADLLCQCKVSEARIRVVHNGVRPEDFRPDRAMGQRLGQLRKKYALDGRFVLLTIARLVPRKGHAAVLKALAGLKGLIPELRYVVTGEGPAKSSLQEAVRELSLEDTVIFTGEVSDQERTALLHGCDVFIMPNRDILRPDGVLDTEGFGIVFLEASACEKPVIAGRAGGVPEAVLDGRTGLLVDPSSERELKEAILRLWSDRELAIRLGQEGRRRVAAEFTWDRLTERYVNEIRDVLTL
jgi:phosphatidylinositol alpha-1,6-mannosyltransferase